MSDIEKMDLESKDLVAERVELLKSLFPEIAVEGDGTIDFEKLRLILGDEVDEGQERYAFTWPGKADVIRQAQTPTTATLRPDEGSSVNWDTTENLYIEGDNLEVLKLLYRGYHREVKMIYIDPPYNTGHDFVYKDSFQDSIDNYKEQAGLSGQTNADTSGRYHSDWLSMMYPRLRLARELLSFDGVIIISIDDNEVNNCIQICNEIFGEHNFIAQFVVASNSSKNNAKLVSISHEYALCYARQKDTLVDEWKVKKNNIDEYVKRVNQLLRKGLSEEDIHAELLELTKYPRFYDFDHYTYADERGVFRADNPGGVSGGNTSYIVKHPATGKVCAAPSGGWRYKDDEMDRLLSDNQFLFGDDESVVPQRKRYLADYQEQVPKSVLFFDSQSSTKWLKGNKLSFDFPKSIDLLKYFFSIVSSDALILDFFSGSATTAHALMELNASDGGSRRFVLVQLPEQLKEGGIAQTDGYRSLCEVGEERIRLAGKAIKTEIEEENKQMKLGGDPRKVPDIGFRVLKLDSSNFEQVSNGALINDLIKPGRSNDDIIFEMMLKWGLKLSLPMEKTEVVGYPVTSIAADELICCMDEGLTVEVLEAIAALEPKRVFFLDSILTDTLKLNAAQIFRRVGDKLGYEIELRTA